MEDLYRSVVLLRVRSPTVFVFLGLIAALLGFMPKVPLLDSVPVWVSVAMIFVAAHALVEVIPRVAGMLKPSPRRRILGVHGDVLQVRLEREFDIPIRQIAGVRIPSPMAILVLPSLELRFQRGDGSEFIIRTAVSDTALFRALEALEQGFGRGQRVEKEFDADQ